FRGHQKFIERCGHAALEQDWLFRAPRTFQKREVLHIPRADLNHVGVVFHQIEALVVDRLSDDSESVSIADFRQNPEPLFTKSLKTVRGSARLVCAAAKQSNARPFQLLADSHALFFSLNPTWARHQSDVLTTNEDVSRRRSNSQNGVFFFGVAAD